MSDNELRIFTKTVVSCGSGCPYFQRHNAGAGLKYHCYAVEEPPGERQIDMPLKGLFPEWCPLPKGPDRIAKLEAALDRLVTYVDLMHVQLPSMLMKAEAMGECAAAAEVWWKGKETYAD